MKKFFAVLILAGLFLSSCTSVLPVAGASGKVGTKVGKASATSFLGLPLTGDAGIAAAAKSAGISQVGTVDLEVSWMLFMITYTTTVTGE